MAKGKGKGASIDAGTLFFNMVGAASDFVKDSKQAVQKGFAGFGKKIGNDLGEEVGEETGIGFEKKFDKKAFAKTVGGAVTAIGIGALLAKSFKDGMEIADLPGTIKAQTGASTAEAQSLTNAIRETFNSGMGDSVATITEQAVALQRAFTLADLGDVTGDMLRQFVGASQIMGYEASEIGRTIGTMMTNGIVDSTEDGLDLLTSVYQNGGDVAGDMLDTFNEYSTKFRDLGLSGAEAAQLMIQAMKAGSRDLDFPADALKEFQIRAIDGSVLSIEAFRSLGLSAEEMIAKISKGGEGAKEGLSEVLDRLRSIEDPAMRTQIAVGLFGTKAEDLGDALLAMDLDTPVEGMEDLNDTTDKAIENNMGFEEQLNSISRAITGKFTDALLPLMPMFKDFGDLVIGFLTFLKDNPFITVVLGSIAIALGLVGAAQWAWNAAVMANPITRMLMLVVGAISLLVAGIWWLLENWESVWGAISGWFNDVVQNITALGDNWNEMWANVIGWIKSARDELANFANDLVVALGLAEEFHDNENPDGSKVTKQQVSAVEAWVENGKKGKHPLANVPGLATGGRVQTPGAVLIGEEGPELYHMERGATVTPLDHNSVAGTSNSSTQKSVTFISNNPVGENTSVTARRNLELISEGFFA